MYVSRKLMAAVVGLVGMLVAEYAGLELPPEILDRATDIIMVYIGAQGIADAAQGVKGRAREQIYYRRRREPKA